MANVLFKRGNTNTINGTAITDGQLLYNTTTGQHYIDSDLTRKEVGKPVVNTTAEVSAITADNIPCGTKPVKELISNLENMKSKTLWTGNFTTGSIVVPNLMDYWLIMVTVGDAPCLGISNYGGSLYCGYGAYTIGQLAYRFSVSGNTLTIDDNNRGGTDGTKNMAVTAIYGLVRA